MTPSRSIKLFGTEEPVSEPVALKAGPLEASLDAGNLRYIRVGGNEALRAIAFLVRDRNWGTYSAEISDLRVEQAADRFFVTYDAVCRDAAQSLQLSCADRGTGRRQPDIRGGLRGARRLRHQSHRLRRAAPARRRGRPSRQRRAHRRLDRREHLSRTDRPRLSLPRRPRPHPHHRTRRQGHVPHGRRRLRDGGPPQLDGRLLQDLHPPAGAPLALPVREGREVLAAGGHDRDRRGRRRRSLGQPGHHRDGRRTHRLHHAAHRSRGAVRAPRRGAPARGQVEGGRGRLPGLPLRSAQGRRRGRHAGPRQARRGARRGARARGHRPLPRRRRQADRRSVHPEARHGGGPRSRGRRPVRQRRRLPGNRPRLHAPGLDLSPRPDLERTLRRGARSPSLRRWWAAACSATSPN